MVAPKLKVRHHSWNILTMPTLDCNNRSKPIKVWDVYLKLIIPAWATHGVYESRIPWGNQGISSNLHDFLILNCILQDVHSLLFCILDFYELFIFALGSNTMKLYDLIIVQKSIVKHGFITLKRIHLRMEVLHLQTLPMNHTFKLHGAFTLIQPEKSDTVWSRSPQRGTRSRVQDLLFSKKLSCGNNFAEIEWS